MFDISSPVCAHRTNTEIGICHHPPIQHTFPSDADEWCLLICSGYGDGCSRFLFLEYNKNNFNNIFSCRVGSSLYCVCVLPSHANALKSPLQISFNIFYFFLSMTVLRPLKMITVIMVVVAVDGIFFLNRWSYNNFDRLAYWLLATKHLTITRLANTIISCVHPVPASVQVHGHWTGFSIPILLVSLCVNNDIDSFQLLLPLSPLVVWH